MELVIFVGLPGSGKTTAFRERYAETHVHVSKDHWPKARNRARKQRIAVEEALAAGRSVVVDNTHPAIEDRAEPIAQGRAHGARIVAIWFDVPVPVCRDRNDQREGLARVPLVAIYTAAKRLVPPTMEEGFDEVLRVAMADEGNSGP